MRHDFPLTSAADFVGLRYFPPPEHLAEFFSSAYLFTAQKSRVADVTRADIAQLRFMIAGEGVYRFSSGERAPTPRCCLLGPTLGATRFDCKGPLQVFGVGILPLGWHVMTAAEAAKYADTAVDLEATRSGSTHSEILRELCMIEDPAHAVERLWTFLATRLGGGSPASPAVRKFITATDAWLVDERSPRIADLVKATGLSGRQLERLCNRLYGAPPKYLARKYRALRCAVQIALDHRDWQDLITDAFYDQSHLIREVKHFVGLTPLQLRSDPSVVTRLALTRRDVPGPLATLSRIS
jgi:AraC-like DNA-binding protein